MLLLLNVNRFVEMNAIDAGLFFVINFCDVKERCAKAFVTGIAMNKAKKRCLICPCRCRQL